MLDQRLHKAPRENSKKIFFAEYAKEFKNQEGPGPGIYIYEDYNCSFPSKFAYSNINTGFGKVVYLINRIGRQKAGVISNEG